MGRPAEHSDAVRAGRWGDPEKHSIPIIRTESPTWGAWGTCDYYGKIRKAQYACTLSSMTTQLLSPPQIPVSWLQECQPLTGLTGLINFLFDWMREPPPNTKRWGCGRRGQICNQSSLICRDTCKAQREAGDVWHQPYLHPFVW